MSLHFSKDFFQDEIREDFFVPELMKRAWAAELEVLQVVADICEQHNIPYFADGGTLLGAIRHHGFIPWDDDLDIHLKRPDYNRLISLLPENLPNGFVLTGMYAHDKRLQRATLTPQARVMADEECYDLLSYMKRFHGFPFFRVGVDIFPVDYLPENPELSAKQKQKMIEIWVLLEKWIQDEACPVLQFEDQLQKIENMCNVPLPRDDSVVNQLWKLYDSVCSQYSQYDTNLMTVYHYWANDPNLFFTKSCYDKQILFPFENVKIPVPSGYDEILTAFFGDWHVPKNIQVHEFYPFYANQKKELKKRFKENGISRSITQFCRDYMESSEEISEKDIDNTDSLKKRLNEMAGLFEQGECVQEGMNQLVGIMELVVPLPECAAYVNPLLDAIESQEYSLASKYFRKMAGQLEQ